jgi:hypothetical protein
VLNKVAVSLLTTASLASAACTIDVQGEGSPQGVVVREQKRIALTGTPTLQIRTFDGSIRLLPGEPNEVVVDIQRRAATSADAGQIAVEVTEDGGNVLIEAKQPPRSHDLIRLGPWVSPSVRLTVTVPRTLNVNARTGDGAIDAQDISGRVELRTADGSVRLQRVTGEIRVTTGDGAVSARGLDGIVAVATGDGSVEMSGRFEELRARTGDGAIGVDVLPGSAMRGEWRLASGDGSVMIRLPEEFNADLDAHTGDGTIQTTGVTLSRPQKHGERRNDLRGRIGTGGELLTVRTGDGSINVVAR